MTVRTGRFELSGVERMRYFAEPWLYPKGHRSYAPYPYTLLNYYGGFMQRIYDWQGRPRKVGRV